MFNVPCLAKKTVLKPRHYHIRNVTAELLSQVIKDMKKRDSIAVTNK